MATTHVIDFTVVEDDNFYVPIESAAPLRFSEANGLGKPIGRPATAMNKKQIRRRIRRKDVVGNEELKILYGKGIEDWDLEELARGRARDKNGHFSGVTPGYISRSVHEQSMRRFTDIVKAEMNAHTVGALQFMGHVLNNNKVDAKGRPLVPYATKLDAAKFLIEHVIGKPKQHIETDISVKLQGILGMAMVNPTPGGGVALTQGYLDADSYEEDDPE